MENNIIWGNVTYQEMVRERPLGWGVLNPPIINHFWFEAQDPHTLIGWMGTNYTLAYYVGALYVVVIFGIQYWMKNRPAYHLQRPLLYWNAFLGLFSIFAFVRMLPSFVHTLSQPNGLYTSVCVKEGIDVPTAFWIYVMTWSKFFELGDTIFIVLRKRPLIFLQWFHHLITMVVAYTTIPFTEPASRWYTVMNSGVHAVMYPYFSLRAGGVKIPKFIANFITTIQFLQMLVGLGVNVASMYMHGAGYYCDRDPFSIKTWSILYACFVVLFGKLFYENVIAGRKHKKKE